MTSDDAVQRAEDSQPDPRTQQDPDGDPGQVNPRDLRGVESEDGAATDDATDTDGDPETLNPREA